jgi:hypothetical protein
MKLAQNVSEKILALFLVLALATSRLLVQGLESILSKLMGARLRWKMMGLLRLTCYFSSTNPKPMTSLVDALYREVTGVSSIRSYMDTLRGEGVPLPLRMSLGAELLSGKGREILKDLRNAKVTGITFKTSQVQDRSENVQNGIYRRFLRGLTAEQLLLWAKNRPKQWQEEHSASGITVEAYLNRELLKIVKSARDQEE